MAKIINKYKILKLFGLQIRKTKIPNHIAFILDGNGRWAKKRKQKRLWGHNAGARRVVQIIDECNKLGIAVISLFALSTENLNRPKDEVDGLFEIFEKFLTDYEDIIMQNYHFVTSGDLSCFPLALQEKLCCLVENTKNNNKMTINICLNYGGKQEIIRAINLIIREKKVNINESELNNYFYCPNLPPIDFLIRTGREKRLSNFMLYQSAYAELYFCNTFWPDFTKRKLHQALLQFGKRERRFGKV